jgi:hypothetical protein
VVGRTYQCFLIWNVIQVAYNIIIYVWAKPLNVIKNCNGSSESLHDNLYWRMLFIDAYQCPQKKGEGHCMKHFIVIQCAISMIIVAEHSSITYHKQDPICKWCTENLVISLLTYLFRKNIYITVL